jgi:hypothetical protein
MCLIKHHIMPRISKKHVKEIVDSSRVEGKELLAWFKRERTTKTLTSTGWIISTLQTERAEQFYAKFIWMGFPNIKSLEKVDMKDEKFKKMFDSTDDINWLSKWLSNINDSYGICCSCECHTSINPLTEEYFEWCEECTAELEELQKQEDEEEDEEQV